MIFSNVPIFGPDTSALNHLYSVNHFFISIELSFPIKLWWIVLLLRVNSFFVMRLLNGNRGWFHIFNEISDHVTLVQLIDTAGNVNHAVSITGCCIYDSNEKEHFLWWKNHWLLFFLRLKMIRLCILKFKMFTILLGMLIQRKNQKILNS